MLSTFPRLQKGHALFRDETRVTPKIGHRDTMEGPEKKRGEKTWNKEDSRETGNLKKKSGRERKDGERVLSCPASPWGWLQNLARPWTSIDRENSPCRTLLLPPRSLLRLGRLLDEAQLSRSGFGHFFRAAGEEAAAPAGESRSPGRGTPISRFLRQGLAKQKNKRAGEEKEVTGLKKMCERIAKVEREETRG